VEITELTGNAFLTSLSRRDVTRDVTLRDVTRDVTAGAWLYTILDAAAVLEIIFTVPPTKIQERDWSISRHVSCKALCVELTTPTCVTVEKYHFSCRYILSGLQRSREVVVFMFFTQCSVQTTL